jgi:uncharacterized protein (DUF736 family)
MSDQYDNTNRGVLFINDQMGNEKRPNYRGSLTINVSTADKDPVLVDFNVSGWKKTSKKGTTFLSLSVERKPEIEQAPPVTKPNAPTFDDLADMPF